MSPLDPILPVDLEREVFETTALMYPKSTPKLLLIARRVKFWIEPLPYRVVCISAPCEPDSDLDESFSALEICEPEPDSLPTNEFDIFYSYKEFHHLLKVKPVIGSYVRHLAFMDNQTAAEITSILSACGAITNLLLFFVGDEAHLDRLARLPLQRLSVYLQLLFPPPAEKDFGHPLFANITHLDIWYTMRDSKRWESWSKLALIPRLSHLSFHDDHISPAVHRGALKHCKFLKVLAIIYTSRKDLRRGQTPARADLASDPRFVILLVPDFLGDWETGARGGEDYWIRAEELVQRRRSGETDSLY
ncbi:hypothetical protein B0H19DRAFT_1193455 [Mycena capillaripes]|nr:hypothetical protein B0H19DRAFT_1193455 [Mycena capillaripes]